MTRRTEVSSYERAVEGILNHIIAHGMHPGDSLPPERELCDELGVSRTTLRSAISHLVSIHVIDRRQGSGNYLCPLRPTVQLDDLSGFSKIVRSIGGEPSSRVLACEALPAGPVIGSRLNLPEEGLVLHLDRLRLLDGAPAMFESSWLSLERFPRLETFDFEKQSLSQVLADEYNVAVAHVTLRVTVGSAAAREAELMELALGDSIFLERGMRMGPDADPIEYYRARYSPRHFKISCKTVV